MKTNKKTAAQLVNTGNIWEQKARLEKAICLFQHLPSGFVGADASARRNCATLLRTCSQEDRNVYAISAGCKNIVSNNTWELFCQMVEGK